MTGSLDCYAILEVTQTAGLAEVKTAYHRLAKLRHPDKNRGDPRATAKFQEVIDSRSSDILPHLLIFGSSQKHIKYCLIPHDGVFTIFGTNPHLQQEKAHHGAIPIKRERTRRALMAPRKTREMDFLTRVECRNSSEKEID